MTYTIPSIGKNQKKIPFLVVLAKIFTLENVPSQTLRDMIYNNPLVTKLPTFSPLLDQSLDESIERSASKGKPSEEPEKIKSAVKKVRTARIKIIKREESASLVKAVPISSAKGFSHKL
ncbi:hypothetical protein RJT34_00881 [Clitoria ternatea]|uniref:Uncharacterized protein n=1 Tax=Clitoria ternatea TaxID=43366 RepID=A0AAN9KIV4_CLITE